MVQGKRSHIDVFFAQYPEFGFDQSAPIWSEFERMRAEFGWDADDYEMRDARRKFKSAMGQEFNDIYGTDETEIEPWQHLCRISYINPIPSTLEDCRKVGAVPPHCTTLMVLVTRA